MTRVQRTIILLGLPAALFIGIALFAPRPAPVFGRTALAITVLGGAYAFAYAVIGLATRRVRLPLALGALSLAAGAFLLGTRYLPSALPGAALLVTVGSLLLIVGAVMMARG